MGMFQQRREDEENQWAGLPSEPLDRGAAEALDAPPALDPLSIGLGLDGDTTSIVFPVAPTPPAAFAVENRDPDGEDGDDAARTPDA